MGSDGGAGVRELLRALGTERMHPFLEWTQEGEDLRASELGELIARWYRFRSEALSFLHDHDVVLCPVNAVPAPLHDEPTPFRYCYPYNLLGWPVAVVRCGTSPEGLPIGVQVVARPWREDVALAVASVLEGAFGGWRPPGD